MFLLVLDGGVGKLIQTYERDIIQHFTQGMRTARGVHMMHYTLHDSDIVLSNKILNTCAVEDSLLSFHTHGAVFIIICVCTFEA